MGARLRPYGIISPLIWLLALQADKVNSIGTRAHAGRPSAEAANSFLPHLPRPIPLPVGILDKASEGRIVRLTYALPSVTFA